MKEITFNEINNQPKYKVGDIVGAYMFGEYALVSIEGVEVKRLSPYDLNKAREVATEDIPLNKVKYITRLGGLYESGIVDVGLEAVQTRIRSLEKRVDGLNFSLEEIRGIVGYGYD